LSKILITCAHPDDETLGMGGTIFLHRKKGDQIFVLIFADGESARGRENAKISERKKQAKKALSILGVTDIKFLNYKDQKLDTISLVELSQEIENVISKWKPDIVYTHFWGDVNQDHRAIFQSTQIATRPTPTQIVKKLICYETPSSTEWALPTQQFIPNLFVNIKSSIKSKVEAFKIYKNEVMDFPHPRSIEGITNRAKYWGCTTGLEYSEAFIVLRDTKNKI